MLSAIGGINWGDEGKGRMVDLLSQEGIQVTTKEISKWETNAREPALHVFLTLCQ